MNSQMFETMHLVLATMWRRCLIVTPILLMPLFGVIAGKLVPRVYEACMTLLVQEPAKLNPFLNDFAVATNLKDCMAGLQTLVHSEHILGEVVDQLSLVPAAGTLAERERTIQRLSTTLTVTLIGSDLIDLRLRGERPAGLDRVLAAEGQSGGRHQGADGRRRGTAAGVRDGRRQRGNAASQPAAVAAEEPAGGSGPARDPGAGGRAA